jgi:hypothetical protein
MNVYASSPYTKKQMQEMIAYNKAAKERLKARNRAREVQLQLAGIVCTEFSPPPTLHTTEVFNNEQEYFMAEFRRNRGFKTKDRPNICILHH